MRLTQREMRTEMAKVEYRQFEIKGYEKMIDRIMKAPLTAAEAKKNEDLTNRLTTIREQMKT